MASGTQLSPEMVGTQLRIVTEEEEIIGELFSYHGGLVALVQNPSAGVDHGRFSFRVINASIITNVTVEKPSEASTLVAGIGDISGPLDMNRILATEKKALAAAQKAASQINPSVSPQAQQLFNQLAKTLPCRWGGNQEIIVLDEIRIPPPYDKCIGKEGNTLQHVQLTLEGERARLAKKASKN
eukprot:CAMPEP_0201521814 /NCGR_PEP_ID=MMETSP0161_2-20130828/16288_1 /ASSEMBLY_ACC=CAM_ASM_000251 /TAXON_ID=180227 /ORGANISM="Neoparamoeba aestuarina, Strain SoJaBio B1-5/56/2" /LENGTH=183 /DNA_ID=CAMNT_0047920525 /DNA_START=53 /DNA_END=604 /DNA_ORIENTATION=-